jgi:tetratricopeptide (TPR) repeat protein
MASVAEAVARGWQCYHAGNLAQAEQIFREVLRIDPNNATVLYFCGVACQVQGKLELATASYEQALRVRPDYAEVHNNLGIVYATQMRWEEALACYRRGCWYKTDDADLYSNMGSALTALGRFDEAVDVLREAIRLRPDSAGAFYNLGNAFLGNALQKGGQFEEAIESYEQAIALRPDYPDVYNSLGFLRQQQARFDEAMECYAKAIELQPDHVGAHVGRGSALQDQGRVDEALAWFARAIELNPDHVRAHECRGAALLLQGKVEAGWAELEWRFRDPRCGRRPYAQPAWDGSALARRTILLYAEWQLGDTIHFMRYAPQAKERVGRVVVEAPAAILPLLARTPGIDQLVARDSPLPDFDVYAALPSLPHLLGITLATIPASVPYVFADPDLVEHWRQELSEIRGYKVGIAWRGGKVYPADAHRSIPLAYMAPLVSVEGIHLISLQKGPGSEELAALGGHFAVTDLASRLDEQSGAFMDTAAVMKSLDLVISVDTSIGHLAGALGVPTWLALGMIPHWFWFTHREDSAWYPGHRLFRRTLGQSWDDVFQRMAGELRKRVNASKHH